MTPLQRALTRRYEELLGVIHVSSHKVRFERGEMIIYSLNEQGRKRDLAKVLLLPGDLAEAISAPKRRPRRRA